MERDAWISYYENAPSAVRFYLLSAQSKINEDNTQIKLAYDNDVWDRVMDAVWDVVFGGGTRQEFQDRIKQFAGDRKPEDVEREVLFGVVLPMADLVAWDVDAALEGLGLNQAQIQSVPRISLRPVSYGAAVRRIATNANVSLLSEEMVRRVREALVSYVKGVRTIEQFTEILLRGQNDGGVGMSREQADQFVAAMNTFLSTTQVMSEEDYGRWISDYEAHAEERRLAPAIATAKATELALEAAGVPRAAPEIRTALDAAVEQAIAQVNHPELDEYLQKRVRNLISTRLRDVRNPQQVKEVLQREAKVGGVGLVPEEADRIGALIETIYKEQRTKVADEEKVKIDSTLIEQNKLIDERRKRDTEERTKWYEDKVRATQSAQEKQTQVLSALKRMSQGQSTNIPPIGPTVTVERSMPSRALSEQEPVASRPMVDAIRAPIRLTGLTEEIGSLTLEDFRRLAKTPDQAVEKIKQKLEALHQESFERWTEGLQSWRKSPLQQLYLKLISESFAAGMPVAELAEKKHKENPVWPSPDELGALISLNSQLQF